MPRSIERTWPPDPSASGGRRSRIGFRYLAFVPDPIVRMEPAVTFDVADATADAETAIRTLNQHGSVAGLDAIGPLLLRSEAVASSRIEGIDVTSLNLARALIDPRAAMGAARQVAANVSAMEEAVAIEGSGNRFGLPELLAIQCDPGGGGAASSPREASDRAELDRWTARQPVGR
jgi:hypothetical protein